MAVSVEKSSSDLLLENRTGYFDELFDVDYDEEGKIIDFLTGNTLLTKPEEIVRQQYLKKLHFEYGYPKNRMATEVAIYYGRKSEDYTGKNVRADIVVYEDVKSCKDRLQHKISLIVECKAPSKKDGMDQLASYIFNTSANGAVWCNNIDDPEYFRRFSSPENKLVSWVGIPHSGESWDSLGFISKSKLIRPKDIKGILRRCHNKIHAKGNDSDESDLTMDIVRIILAKARDEEKIGNKALFYCTPEEYLTETGSKNAADRVKKLFKEVANDNKGVFSEHEKIAISDKLICDVIIELQHYRLLSDLYSSDDWDIMGNAYEQYTASYLKRQQGQFFTNRLVTDFMVRFLDPDYDDIILDPAGGSGGFLTSSMRYVRRKILKRLKEGHQNKIASQRQLDNHRTKLFMVEINKRLVKIAKTAMILNGDGHAGITHGNSLSNYDDLDKSLQAYSGKSMPTIILTNPPFAGIGQGRITDEKILNNYSCGMKWTSRDGKLEASEIYEDGVPPEMLFFERCLDWIAPGGKIGIVMPKSFLDTKTYLPARSILLKNYKLLSVIICNKNTFQPHTGVRTCILFIEKPEKQTKYAKPYPIYMALSRKIGQDSEGVPIFKFDSNNKQTELLDEDLSDILNDWTKFKANELTESEYRFSVSSDDISSTDLNINPQFYLPSINNTIKEIESIDQHEGWSVTTLSQVSSTGIKIFKAPRMKTENLIVEDFINEWCETYNTPSSVLQEKGDASKILDISKANKKQIAAIRDLRVQHGDILITRSGTIGRVSYATKRIAGKILSDDMIRVRITEENLRFYVYAYLQSNFAYQQMLKNEYGTIQQHLEARHIQNIIIPVPDDWSTVMEIVTETQNAIISKERMELSNRNSKKSTLAMISSLIKESLNDSTKNNE
ncbi:N-6 DNA methylase [Citrobacter freundii]|nr:N-6 DNA methylase [Citrobacter freundii]